MVCVQKEHNLPALAFTNLEGESRLLDPYQALRTAECGPWPAGVPLPKPLSNHHDLVAQAVTGPLLTPAAHQEGALTGVRKRCWDRLRNYREKYPGTLFAEGVDRALDELFRKPLLEDATHRLAKALRERTPEDLANLIVSLHEEGRLCVPDAELEEAEIRLLCSLGFTP